MKDNIKKTLIIPTKLDAMLRIQAAIHGNSQGQEVVDILTAGIESHVFSLIESEKQVVYSEKDLSEAAPKKIKKILP